MANNRFNKQVTPKGYQKGGSVKEEPMRDRKKQPLKRKNFKDADPDRKFLKQKQGKKFFEAKAGGRAGKMGGGMMQRPMYNKGGDIKKPESKKPESKKPESKNKIRIRPRIDKIKSRIPIPSEVRDMNEKIKKKKESGKKDIFDYIGDIIKTPYKIRGGNSDGGRIKKKMGGPLKAIPSENKGLKKLPTEVRNKMGFMKKGGKVHGK